MQNLTEAAEEDKNSSKISKRRKMDRGKWESTINKDLRMKGLEYKGMVKDEAGKWKYGKNKCKRIMKSPCTCSHSSKAKSRVCKNITEVQRKSIFDNFWKEMTWKERKMYIKGLVDTVPIQRRRGDAEQSNRSHTFHYHFSIEGQRQEICKAMFLNTLSIGEWSVRSWVLKKSHPTSQKELSSRGGNDKGLRKSASDFFSKLPKMESHYCRSTSSKLYLEPNWQSKAALYNQYKEFCKESKAPQASMKVFADVFDDLNLSLFSPKKDRCDLCCSYEAGNLEEERYQHHIFAKNKARKAKQDDKNSTGNSRVFTMDLQAVLLCPALSASALYYKTKLKVHNFTIYDLQSKDAFCYLWHEAEGGLTADEFASIIVDFIEKEVPEDEVILFSDGCTYQNRNAILANALLSVAIKKNKTIIQKFLEKGHTQMECDSVHSSIERRLKNRQIFTPGMYVEACLTARQKPKPYKVEYIQHEFFKAYHTLSWYSSIRPGSKAGDPTVTDIRCLRYNHSGMIDYKLSFDDEWKILPRRISKSKEDASIPQLYSSCIKIKAEKFTHLQQLKKVIPQDFHAFYDSLPHECTQKPCKHLIRNK